MKMQKLMPPPPDRFTDAWLARVRIAPGLNVREVEVVEQQDFLRFAAAAAGLDVIALLPQQIDQGPAQLRVIFDTVGTHGGGLCANFAPNAQLDSWAMRSRQAAARRSASSQVSVPCNCSR